MSKQPQTQKQPLLRRVIAVLGVVSLAAAALIATPTLANAGAETVVLDSHHTDAFSVRYENEKLVLKTRADLPGANAKVLDPSRVLFQVRDSQKTKVPAASDYSFLGDAGKEIWMIKQTYETGSLWAGWETESLTRGLFQDDALELEVVDISGPGRVEIYLNELDGPKRLISSTNPELRKIDVPTGAHTHANWAFDQPGNYVFSVQASAKTRLGTDLKSAITQYQFKIGEGQDAPISPSPNPSTDPSVAPTPVPSADPSADPNADPSEAPVPSPEPSTEPSPAPSIQPQPEGEEPSDGIDPEQQPTEPLAAPEEDNLTASTEGKVTVSPQTLRQGENVTIKIDPSLAKHWVSVWMFSTPKDLGWKQLNSEGEVIAAVPADAPIGQHRIAVLDRESSVIGWQSITVAAPEAVAEQCIATPVTKTIPGGAADVAASGHFDFGPVIEGGSMRALYKDDRSSPAKWVDPAGLVMHLGESSAVQAPGGDFSFLGSGTVYQIPLTQKSDVPWLGWNTQHPTIAGKVSGKITLTLDALDGPGELAVYSVGSFGNLEHRYFGTVSGFGRSTSIDVGSSGVHVHGIWAFTKPGTYYATMTFSGTVDGKQQRATSKLTFFVGAGNPSSAATGERTVTSYVGRTASGAECELTLPQTGITAAQSSEMLALAATFAVLGMALLAASALAPRRRGSARN